MTVAHPLAVGGETVIGHSANTHGSPWRFVRITLLPKHSARVAPTLLLENGILRISLSALKSRARVHLFDGAGERKRQVWNVADQGRCEAQFLKNSAPFAGTADFQAAVARV